MALFHLAFPVTDLAATRSFYGELLGCPIGRESEQWIDFDFFDHQITAHLDPQADAVASKNPVDGKQIPVRHFGAILEWDDWGALGDKFRRAGIEFVIEPYVRFKGEAGEQGTLFIKDPSGNHLEFKAFRDMSRVFARQL